MHKANPVIGVIGGHGRMGAWFARWFEQLGYTILVSDLATELSNEQLVRQSDVVAFSVPISRTVEVIESLVPLSRPDQLWLDFTSIKQPAVMAMLKSAAEVVGLHPMFGPSTESISGQTVVLCPARMTQWDGWIEQLLTSADARVKQTTPEAHDQMMTAVQGITHFAMFSMAYTYRLMGLDITESLGYTSPVYEIQLDMMGRYLAQDPQLYAEIQTLNPSMGEALDKYATAAATLAELVKTGDQAGIIAYIRSAAEHFGSYKETALRQSDALIDAKVKAKHDHNN